MAGVGLLPNERLNFRPPSSGRGPWRRMTSTARTLSHATLLILWLLPAASPAFAQNTSDIPSTIKPGEQTPLERAEWALVRPTPMVTLHVRKFVGYVMLVPAGTLFLLYLFRPRPYVIAGAFAWAAGSLMLLALSFDSGGGGSPNTITVGRLGIGAWSACSLIFGAAMRFASGWFRSPSVISRSMFWTLAVALGWTIFGAALLRRPGAILVPAFILMTAWHLRSAYGYLEIARQHRFVGAWLAGAGVLGIATFNITAAIVVIVAGGIGQASSNVAYLNFLSSSLLVLGMHLVIFEDLIEELRAAAAQIASSRDEMKAMAVTDPLTRCYNRRLLYEITDHELEQHRRYNMPLSILYIDIDHFKAINDTKGHHTGDEVLRTVAQILRELTRQADFVFRWGGDEFLVLLSAAEPDAKIKAQQIRRAFLESAIVSNLPDGVDLSIGCVPVPPETRDFDPLIDQADREMYRRTRALAS
jgi:diguanylate cyclase (GGDEF)-like protein